MLKRIPRLLSRKEGAAKIAGIVRQEFDSSYYRKHNSDVTGDSLTHYIRHGWKEGRNPAEWFSVTDYLSDNPDVAAANFEPFQHYLIHGRSEGRVAIPVQGSDARAARDFADIYGRFFHQFPPNFDVQLYGLASGRLNENRWKLLEHFVQDGVFQPRLFAVVQPQSELLISIGEFYADFDRIKALRCFNLAKMSCAKNPSLMHKIGDCYFGLGYKTSAQSAYLESIRLGGNYYWTYHTLGSISLELGDFDNAIGYLKKAVEIRPEKYRARHELHRALSERFHVQWIKAIRVSLSGNDQIAAVDTSTAVTDYQSEFAVFELFADDHRNKDGYDPPNVAIFGSDVLPQCKLYRITQKIDQLSAVGLSADFYSLSQSGELLKAIMKYDILIVYRAPALPEVMDVIYSARKFGIVTCYDIDDLVFDLDFYPPPRDSLADMVTPAEYAGLVTGGVLFREAMAMCDYGIASTPPLQEAIAKIVRRKQCFLSRNALGQAHIKQVSHGVRQTGTRTSKFIFFYGSGSRSHNENFALLAKPLADVLRKHPNCELRVVGPLTIGEEFRGLHRQVTQLPFTDISEYWRELSTADVNLAPLISSRFNDGKSEIKWLEAGMLGIPSVVSPSAVYDPLIRHGHDGFVARTQADWASILAKLIKDPGQAASIGLNARQRVLEDYAIQRGGENLLAILDQAIEGERANSRQVPHDKPLILVVNIFYPPEYVGGATRVVEQTVTDMLEDGGDYLSIEIFCGREPDGNPGSVERYKWNGVSVTSLSPFNDHDSIERSVETESFFNAYLDRVRPDLIHFHAIQHLGASLIDVAVRKDIPYVVSVHDGWWISDRQFLIDEAGVPVYESGKWGDPRRLDRLKNALNGAHATIAVSQEQARLYRDRGIRNVMTIANGSDTLPGVAVPPNDGPVWLGLLGGLGLAKGADLLREALRRRTYGNLRFLVVDHSMLEGMVRRERWGDNWVEIIGKASFAGVAQVYSRLHVVLAISVCVESFGLVAREAQRLGRWVIASDRGGMGEDIVDGQNGHIIDPSRIADLIDVLDAINADPARYRLAPPKTVELRDRKDVAADFLQLYRSILDERNAPAATVRSKS